ncbi:hypothetical protein PQ455_07455 [Sphingomonas naphthae]|uniref:Uncharacterized protein n=1 Tax=Sphingomonas naphthae TaxID=1813468 RepID=A0ABY7TQX7_9SPHN|nr:hypothetical protein [Sphingomonas naphthae]WCT75042.1 hypothetical protein PQ455_07455 [Sphingomonas naphthae]
MILQVMRGTEATVTATANELAVSWIEVPADMDRAAFDHLTITHRVAAGALVPITA